MACKISSRRDNVSWVDNADIRPQVTGIWRRIESIRLQKRKAQRKTYILYWFVKRVSTPSKIRKRNMRRSVCCRFEPNVKACRVISAIGHIKDVETKRIGRIIGAGITLLGIVKDKKLRKFDCFTGSMLWKFQAPPWCVYGGGYIFVMKRSPVETRCRDL